jgi:hypothetical protein
MSEDKLIEAMAREMEPFGFMTEHEEAMNAARDDARSALAAIEPRDTRLCHRPPTRS